MLLYAPVEGQLGRGNSSLHAKMSPYNRAGVQRAASTPTWLAPGSWCIVLQEIWVDSSGLLARMQGGQPDAANIGS